MSVPVPPEGWQYGVVMETAGKGGWVWGCGPGEEGASRQSRRLEFSKAIGPCLLPSAAIEADETDPLADAIRALHRAARDGVIDDKAREDFERVAPKEWMQ